MTAPEAGDEMADEGRPANGILSMTATELQALRRSAPAPAGAVINVTRQHNLSVIRRLLSEYGPQTRPELARRSGLSLPTVGILVTELLDAGTAEDLGVVSEAKVGKPAARIALNAKGNVSAVLDLTHDNAFVGALVDLDGTVVDRVRLEIGKARGTKALDHALDLARTLVERATAQVIGVGVASPGLVDDQGVVHVADRLRWRDVPLGSMLADATGLPVSVGNDVNLLARGLSRSGGRTGRDTIVVALDNGVGAAVLIAGQPEVGEQFAAGEIAHLTVQADGAVCRCGRRGCLDMVVGAGHLARRVKAEGPGVLEPSGRILGEVLAPIAIMLNINVLVVVGPAELVEGPFAEGVVAGVHSRLRPTIIEGMEIAVGAYDPDLVLQGAAAVVMQSQLGVR